MNLILYITLIGLTFNIGTLPFTGTPAERMGIGPCRIVIEISNHIIDTNGFSILELDTVVLFLVIMGRISCIAAGILDPLFQGRFISGKWGQIILDPLTDLVTGSPVRECRLEITDGLFRAAIAVPLVFIPVSQPMGLVVVPDKTFHAIFFIKGIDDIIVIVSEPAIGTVVAIQGIQVMISRILCITGQAGTELVNRIAVKRRNGQRSLRGVRRIINTTNSCSGNNIGPVFLIHVLLIWHSDRISIFAFPVVIPDLQILTVIEILIHTKVYAVFLPLGSFQRAITVGERIFILCITGHIAVCRNEVMPGLIVARRAGIVNRIMMLLPGTCSQINGTLILLAAFTGNNIDNTACSISTVGRSARSLDYFNFINIFHIGDLVKVYTGRLTAVCTAIIIDTAAGCIIHTTAIDQDNHTGITIDGNTIIVELVTIFAAAVPRILECNTRNTLNGFRNIRIMALINFFSRNDLYIAAGTIIGLFSNRIAELVLCTIRIDYHRIQCVGVKVFIVSCMRRSNRSPGYQ